LVKRLALVAAGILGSLLLVACGGAKAASQARAPVTAGPYRDIQALAGPALWDQIQKAEWFGGGNPTPDGQRLLEALRGFGQLATPEQRRLLLEEYSDGLGSDREAAAHEYEKEAGRTPQETLLAPWLADGLDGYERTVLDLQAGKVLPAAVLRHALEDGAFRAAYEANPPFLDADFLHAVGALPPTLWNHIALQPWYTDGVSDAELSLLNMVSVLNYSGEQLNIVDNNLYRFVSLKNGPFAVVADSRDVAKARLALETATPIIPLVEAFAGPYPDRPLGLWFEIDDTRQYGSECFAGSVDGAAAEIFLATPFCFQRGPMVHEIAHTFFRNEYPTWFAEGVAELVAFHVTGARSGYGSGKGLISPDLSLRLADDRYYNESSLGAKFLVASYQLLGPDVMSRFVQQVRPRDMKGKQILDALNSVAPADKRTALRSLMAASFPPTVVP
jgi:hypothetical protein